MLRTLALVAALLAASSSASANEKIAKGDDLRLRQWQDGKALEALPLYEEALKEGADEFEIRWRMASAYFWEGERTTDSKKLVEIGKKCVEQAEKAAKLKPDRVEGHYYTAVCWGTYSHGISIPRALAQGVEGKFKAAAAKAEKLDPSWEDAAPLNAWGRFYFELPWPKRDLPKSQKYLERAMATAPCNLRTRWYLAETILERGEKGAKEKAKEHLDFIAANENCATNPGDGEHAKKAAAKLRKELE